MQLQSKDAVVVLGPTASGKTHLGARLALALGGEVLSVDSRQVYRGLDIGSGKDLEEYRLPGGEVPYHLIDIVDLATEFSVFDYQQAFRAAHADVRRRGKTPVLVGGTGLYLEAVLRGYAMAQAPRNEALRSELATMTQEALAARLRALKPGLHNSTDLSERERTIRAIEIASHTQEHPPEAPEPIDALLLGVRWDRPELRRRITARLAERLDAGLIEEVEALRAQGHSWERLDLLGLEFRFVAEFLQGRIKNRNDLKQKLAAAIARFAKRQETWFRRMERNGFQIHWLDGPDVPGALAAIERHG